MNLKNDKQLRIIIALLVMNIAMIVSPKNLIYAVIGICILGIFEFIQKYKNNEIWVMEVVLTIGIIVPLFVALIGVVYFQWDRILELKILSISLIIGTWYIILSIRKKRKKW